MRLGGPISLALHVAFAVGGVAVAPALVEDAEPVPVFDIELVTIGEVANLKPAAAEEIAEEEVKAEPPPPPPPKPEEVAIPEEAAPPPPKKEEPKPEPKKEEPVDFQKEIERAMKAANSAPTPAKKDEKPANPFKNPNARNTAAGAGDGAQVRIEQYIMRQIIDNGCWGRQTDLADSQTMVATLRVRFVQDGQFGRFDSEPQLIEPTRMPAGGPYLVYVTRAVSGLKKCNNLGFKVPAEYFTVMKSPSIDLRFRPGAD